MSDLSFFKTRLGLFYVVLENMYKCNTGHFGITPLLLFLCCCRGYVHMLYWAFL